MKASIRGLSFTLLIGVFTAAGVALSPTIGGYAAAQDPAPSETYYTQGGPPHNTCSDCLDITAFGGIINNSYSPRYMEVSVTLLAPDGSTYGPNTNWTYGWRVVASVQTKAQPRQEGTWRGEFRYYYQGLGTWWRSASNTYHHWRSDYFYVAPTGSRFEYRLRDDSQCYHLCSEPYHVLDNYVGEFYHRTRWLWGDTGSCQLHTHYGSLTPSPCETP
jgi:hypothetical protein